MLLLGCPPSIHAWTVVDPTPRTPGMRVGVGGGAHEIAHHYAVELPRTAEISTDPGVGDGPLVGLNQGSGWGHRMGHVIFHDVDL